MLLKLIVSFFNLPLRGERGFEINIVAYGNQFLLITPVIDIRDIFWEMLHREDAHTYMISDCMIWKLCYYSCSFVSQALPKDYLERHICLNFKMVFLGPNYGY